MRAARSIERDDLPDRRTRVEIGVGVVDLVEPDTVGDERIQLQPALAVKVEQVGDIDPELVRAHGRALDAAGPDEAGGFEFELHSRLEHAEDGGHATGFEHGKALLGGDLQPQRLKRVRDAAAGQVHDRFDRVGSGDVDDVGRAHLLGELELAVEPVDGDDPAGAGEDGAADDGEAHAAAADDGDHRAGLDLGGVDDRAHAGEHAAADEGGAV